MSHGGAGPAGVDPWEHRDGTLGLGLAWGAQALSGTEGQQVTPALPLKRVLVLSYLNVRNFGDRLGFHVINGLLPANALVTHAALNFAYPPTEDYDLLILGSGHSLNAAAIEKPELQRLIRAIPHSIGIFGTQYPNQYRNMADPGLFPDLLDRMTTWWARYETDVADYGGGRSNVRHLGDWLISAFPLTTPRVDRSLVIAADTREQELALDRTIQQIQVYRRVFSARIHPLLCALTSAEEVAYKEQRESHDPACESGKFRALLLDIFGRTFPEDEYFRVDRAAVLRYKMMVEANMAELRSQICALLA